MAVSNSAIQALERIREICQVQSITSSLNCLEVYAEIAALAEAGVRGYPNPRCVLQAWSPNDPHGPSTRCVLSANHTGRCTPPTWRS